MKKKTRSKKSSVKTEAATSHENQCEELSSTPEDIGNNMESGSPRRNSDEIDQLKDENMYLKLLLGASHRVDQLFGDLRKNLSASDALSNGDSFKRCLGLLDRDEEIEIFVQTFQNLLNISDYLSEHKSRIVSTPTPPPPPQASPHLSPDQTVTPDLDESLADPSWAPPGVRGGGQILSAINPDNLTPISLLGLKLSDKVSF